MDIGFTVKDMNIWNYHYHPNLVKSVKPKHPVTRPIDKQSSKSPQNHQSFKKYRQI